ncbi:GNAT family N-acetyltransferase [Bacillus sp. 165]|uniref:GNAT family N-acetyltransferase n=1 Tax=Bacillus sp. 165 TaxID=1529117 RepID=UPI001AD98068|nr:GNAT family N-acetyltransferase [Bacillus sp. 165]MBO9128526.1 GNAT family N-acetyltransferase [Bacillus sp. 165]
MSDYQLISDYKHIKRYRESFNTLAKQTFGIDFSNWYKNGFWTDKYICYSYVKDDSVIANASISKMKVVINDQEYNAIQIGTVMTHSDYRNQGLSAKLMNHILEKYESEYDFIYLFANKTVLDFYPKFGFTQVEESSFFMKVSDVNNSSSPLYSIRSLNPANIDDFTILKRLATERKSISSVLGVVDIQPLMMFYFIYVFNNSIYYIEEKDAALIYKHEGKELHLFDLLSKDEIDINEILYQIVNSDTESIHFHFTPEHINSIKTENIKPSDDTLFIRPLLKELPKHFYFPITSHA